MLRVAEEAYQSDTGRQRSANEDSFYAQAPVFAVADGMGGAQAGEVASRLAAEAFEPAERADAGPETFLRSIAEAANERIHHLAQADASRSGMGTTLTAALVEGDEISLAHVGDSRAYLFRDGALKLLTSDHSLVEELRRQGRLTDEQAEDHPQRSIITRALGPEPSVQVDTMTYRARPGDVYLLCSDGLTTMVKEARIAEVLADAPDLEAAVGRLIREANESGGRDNITVVAFRLEEAETPAAAPSDTTLVGPSAEEAGLTAETVRAARRPQPQRTRLGGAAAPPPPRRRRGRALLRAAIALAVVAAIAAGAWFALRQVYFLGADDGRLALYRGLPYDLPLGVNLYSQVYSSAVTVDSLPRDRRESATNHTLRSHSDAVSLVEDLEGAAAPPPQAERQRESGGGNRHGGGGKASGGRSG